MEKKVSYSGYFSISFEIWYLFLKEKISAFKNFSIS